MPQPPALALLIRAVLVSLAVVAVAALPQAAPTEPKATAPTTAEPAPSGATKTPPAKSNVALIVGVFAGVTVVSLLFAFVLQKFVVKRVVKTSTDKHGAHAGPA